MEYIGRRKINVKQPVLSAVTSRYEHKTYDKYVESISVIPDATDRILQSVKSSTQILSFRLYSTEEPRGFQNTDPPSTLESIHEHKNMKYFFIQIFQFTMCFLCCSQFPSDYFMAQKLWMFQQSSFIGQTRHSSWLL